MAQDSQKLDQSLFAVHYIWLGPLSLSAICVYLYYTLDSVLFLAGILTLGILVLPVQAGMTLRGLLKIYSMFTYHYYLIQSHCMKATNWSMHFSWNRSQYTIFLSSNIINPMIYVKAWHMSILDAEILYGEKFHSFRFSRWIYAMFLLATWLCFTYNTCVTYVYIYTEAYRPVYRLWLCVRIFGQKLDTAYTSRLIEVGF